MKKVIFILFTFLIFIPNITFWIEWIGESVWLDLYKTIDQGSFKLKETLFEKELNWSAKEINDLLAFSNYWCGIFKKTKCFDENKDFTKSELDSILNEWNVWIISVHLTGGVLEEEISTDTLNNLSEVIKIWIWEKKSEIEKYSDKAQKIWTLWLYSDWSTENSDYDLMTDLEKIHKIIFTEDIPYNWVETNFTSNSLSDFLNSDSDSDNKQNLLQNSDSVWNNLSSLKETKNELSGNTPLPFTPNQTKQSLASCKTWVTLSNLDSNFYNDINNQLLYWNNKNSVSWNSWNTWKKQANSLQTSDSPSASNWPVALQWWDRSLFDTFPCNWFFCIKIDFTMYNQKILGWWKSNSIEKILDKNLEIANKFAAISLIQSVMTQNFLDLSILKSLNLPSMAHLWVVIQQLPPPILNLKSKKTSTPDSTKEFSNKDLLIGVFSSYKIYKDKEKYLDYKTQNDLSFEFDELEIANLANTSTNNSSYIPYTAPKEFVTTAETKLKAGYFNSFNNDLVTIAIFTKSFANTVDNIVLKIKEMDKIPK